MSWKPWKYLTAHGTLLMEIKDGRQGGNGCSQVKIRDRKCLFCIYSLILIALWNRLGFKCLLLVHLIIESSGIIHLYSLLK